VAGLIAAKEALINSTSAAVHAEIAAKLSLIEGTLAKFASVPEGKKLTVNKALSEQAKAASAALDSLAKDLALPLKVSVPQFTYTKLSFPKVQVPNLALPKLELPKDLPKVQLPKVDLPKVQFTKVELPKVQFTKVELPKDLPLPKLALPTVTVSKLAVPTLPAPQLPQLPLAEVQSAVNKAVSDLSHAGVQAAGLVGIKVQP
jgi:hypothetical protein